MRLNLHQTHLREFSKLMENYMKVVEQTRKAARERAEGELKKVDAHLTQEQIDHIMWECFLFFYWDGFGTEWNGMGGLDWIGLDDRAVLKRVSVDQTTIENNHSSDSGQVDDVVSKGLAGQELKSFVHGVEQQHTKMKQLEKEVGTSILIVVVIVVWFGLICCFGFVWFGFGMCIRLLLWLTSGNTIRSLWFMNSLKILQLLWMLNKSHSITLSCEWNQPKIQQEKQLQIFKRQQNMPMWPEG